MPVPFLLLEVLENLSTDELNKFKWFLGLKILKGCDPILTSYLESPHRQDSVSKMMQSYGEENAVNMTVAILKQMKLNNAAEDLQKSHTGGNTGGTAGGNGNVGSNVGRDVGCIVGGNSNMIIFGNSGSTVGSNIGSNC
ncbi:hypothetical protein JOQ06_013014 [Pogonophryne albipinna]|uniref:Pyrin domain-containing protein n=1 Tax=Pogonophryne albipinna TaxID=1090488 RepID=A0AAD6BI59_9TELE|nr:hypothetical protein JOQ06_013014 [Pogonophryne albipinna]